jgi:hypothetical protein
LRRRQASRNVLFSFMWTMGEAVRWSKWFGGRSSDESVVLVD